MDSKIVKIAGTESKAKIIRFFSLINGKRKYICFINYSGKNLNLSTIHLGYISTIGEKIIVFKIETDSEWLRIKTIMENLFTTGTSEEIVTYPVDNIERIDIVDYHTFDKLITDYRTFFNVKVPEEINFNIDIKKPIKDKQTPTPVVPVSVESTTPTAPTRKKGSKMVIILTIILLLLAVAAAIYYFRDDLFKETKPINNNNNGAVIKNNNYADNELVCTLKYNDNESNGIITEKVSYFFNDDKSTVVSVKSENKIKFTDKEEYDTSKQNAQMGLAFATMFDIEMNLDHDDKNLNYIVTMQIDTAKAIESGYKMETSGSYDNIKNQALIIGYTCNGNNKDFEEDFGNEEIKAINDSLTIVSDGWRIVATADAIDENSIAMEFNINIRHLNDSPRDLNGVLTTYDENKNPLSETTILSKNTKGNSFFTIDLDTMIDTEELIENFDYNNIKYYSIKINK